MPTVSLPDATKAACGEGDYDADDAIDALHAFVEGAHQPCLKLCLALLPKSGLALGHLIVLRVGGLDKGQVPRALRQIGGGPGQHGLDPLGNQEFQLRVRPADKETQGNEQQCVVGKRHAQSVHLDDVGGAAEGDGDKAYGGSHQLAGEVAVRGDPADQALAAVGVIAGLPGVDDLPTESAPQV